MSSTIFRFRSTAGLLLAMLPALAAAAVADVRVLGDGVQVDCRQPQPGRLTCEYRLVQPAPVVSVSASIEGTTLPAPELAPLPARREPTLVLFLVDTSKSRTPVTLKNNAGQIRALMRAAPEHFQFGLATFDSDLHMQAPPGSSREEVAAAAEKIEPVGLTTELYRNTLEAVHLLAPYPAGRRAIFLFSDGLAEDTAYFPQDVTHAARDAGVVLYGLGYAESPAHSVGLQSLRRLAEETGGVFVEANREFRLPDSFMQHPYEVLDNGGRLSVDLSAAEKDRLDGARSVRLTWITEKGAAGVRVPVNLPLLEAPAPQASAASAGTASPPAPGAGSATAGSAPAPVSGTVSTTPPAAPAAEAAQPSAPATAQGPAPGTTPAPAKEATSQGKTAAGAAPLPPAAPRPARRGLLSFLPRLREPLPWYAAGGVALLLLVLLALLWRARRGRALKAPASAGPAAPVQPGQPFAYLEMQDGSGTRHPITTAAFRMGRHADNELKLDDPSISRHHAEIHRRRDGTFTVTDLESMNGVFLNNQQVRQAAMADGDLLELGDVAMRFTERPSNELTGEATVMLKTVTPSAMSGQKHKRAG